ncbi:MAG: hypothetical protein SGJ18_15060 [Pseudomonadota bacterium]|mgnify:CR=1 FL=1|nr:hypothetical protein [Pseudomonadota bacterium]
MENITNIFVNDKSKELTDEMVNNLRALLDNRVTENEAGHRSDILTERFLCLYPNKRDEFLKNSEKLLAELMELTELAANTQTDMAFIRKRLEKLLT